VPIKIEHVTHVYAPGTPFETKAIDDINLSISEGEFVGIIGHTGSGKSTLIQHLNALMLPTSGKVLVDGTDTSEKGKATEIRKNVGLVFQYPEYQLFEETVEKDAAFGPRNLGLSEEEIKERVTHALNLTGISEENRKKSPFELSGGQKRRAAIAGVLTMKPKYLIMDEPAAGLDPAGRSEMRKLIRDIRSEGGTIIMVSHSMDDVARMCERIIVMAKGKVALDGTPSQVFRNGEMLEKIGLGLPGGAVLRDRLNKQGFSIPDDVYTLEGVRDAIVKQLKKG